MSYDLSILLQTLLKHAERYLHGKAERHHLAARVKRVPIGRSYGANPKSAMKCFSEFVRVKLELVEPSTSIHGKKSAARQGWMRACVRNWNCHVDSCGSAFMSPHSASNSPLRSTTTCIILILASSSPRPLLSTFHVYTLFLLHIPDTLLAAPDLVRQRSRLPVYPSTSSVHVRRSSPTSVSTTKPIHTAPPPLH